MLKMSSSISSSLLWLQSSKVRLELNLAMLLEDPIVDLERRMGPFSNKGGVVGCTVDFVLLGGTFEACWASFAEPLLALERLVWLLLLDFFFPLEEVLLRSGLVADTSVCSLLVVSSSRGPGSSAWLGRDDAERLQILRMSSSLLSCSLL